MVIFFPRFILAAMLACGVWFAPAPSGAMDTVAVYGPNPHYLQDARGRPVVLIGFGNAMKNPPEILDQLKGKITYQRASFASWDRLEDPDAYAFGRPWPMVNGKADMDTWNETFWRNLHRYIDSARDRGIIVGLTIWDGHVDLPGGKYGSDSVWNAQYNLQGVQWAYNAAALQAFPHPRRSGGSAEKLTYYQRRLIDRLIAEIQGCPNVLIELNNEDAHASRDWWLYWARLFKGGGLVVAVNYEPGAIADAQLAATSTVDMKSYHARSDEEITAARYAYNKVIVADADNTCENLEAQKARGIAWRSVLRGGQWNDFVCHETTPFPDSIKIEYYRNLLDFLKTRAVPFWQMTPNAAVASSGLALVRAGTYYLIYAEQNVSVDLTGAAVDLHYEWYDPRTGTTVDTGMAQGGVRQNFTLPGQGDYVLWIWSTTGGESSASLR